MGFTKLLDPFVRYFSSRNSSDFFVLTVCVQVGPVLDFAALSKGEYTGQFIAAGYSGHGMPRAFSWYGFILIHSSSSAISSLIIILPARKSSHRW